jgi:hypothetical protein
MEIVGGLKYKHKKEDCPRVLGMALRQKYDCMPDLGIMVEDDVLYKNIAKGLNKHGCESNQIYESNKNYINTKQITRLLKHLLNNKKDGFMVLEHNNKIETRHLFGFLYNHEKDTLDFFDSYNDTRELCTIRMDPSRIKSFINETFHKYFKDEFVIEKVFEINQS